MASESIAQGHHNYKSTLIIPFRRLGKRTSLPMRSTISKVNYTLDGSKIITLRDHNEMHLKIIV